MNFMPMPFSRWLNARGSAALCLSSFALLAGCSFTNPPVRPVVYDFGPGVVDAVSAALPSAAVTAAVTPPITLAEVESPPALDSTAVLYRLGYADAQQLHPYAQARWTMPPAQLLRQRLREHLSRRRTVLSQGDTGPAPGIVLRVELDEFSQWFDTPQSSSALVRLRATLLQPGPNGVRLSAQQNFVVQRAAVSADAPGGVKAMAQASDALIAQLDAWLQATMVAP